MYNYNDEVLQRVRQDLVEVKSEAMILIDRANELIEILDSGDIDKYNEMVDSLENGLNHLEVF